MSSKELKGIIVSIGGDSSGLGKAIKNAADMSKQLQTELNQINRNLKFDPSNATLLAQKEEVLTEKIKETKKELELLESVQDDMKKKVESGDLGADKYRAYQREVETTRGVLGNMEKQLDDMKGAQEQAENAMNGVNFSQAETKVDGLKQSYKSFADETKEHLDSVKEKAEAIGSGIETVGKVVSAGSAAAAGALGSGVKFAMDFEDAMAKVSTIAKEDEKPIDVLRQEIIDLSNSTGIEAAEIAENVYNAISAGQSTADAIDFVKNSTALAKAGFTDAGASLDVLTTIMNAYGMKAEEVGNVSDMLIQTQNLGKVTVGQLAESMGKVIPTANSYGVELDQIAAAYSITTANGINAAESTTYINSMLTELGKSGTKASDILKKETGKSFKELMDDGNSLGDVLQIIQDSAEKNGTAFTDVWSKTNAAKGAITLLSDSSKVFNSRLSEMNDSTGATETAMGKLKTTSSETKKIVNELKNAGIDLGDEVLKQAAPILKDIMGGVKNLTEWLKKLSPHQKEVLTKTLEIVAVLGPGITLTGKMVKGVGDAAGALPKLAGALNSAASPVGAATFAIGALVAVISGIALAVDEANKQRLENLGFTDQVNRMQEAVDKMHELQDDVHNMTTDIKDAMSDTHNQLSVVDEYKGRMDELLKKSNLTAEEQAELTTIGDYFSQKYPEFKDAWDNYISVDDNGKIQINGNIDEITGKLDGLINKYKSLAATNAISSIMNQNMEESIRAQDEVNQAAVQIENLKKEKEDFLKKWDLTEEHKASLFNSPDWYTWQSVDKYGNKGRGATATAGDLKKQLKEIDGAITEATKSYQATAKSAAQLSLNNSDLARMQAVVNGNYDDAAAVLMAYNNNLITTNDIEQSRYESLDNLKSKAKETAQETGANMVFGFDNGIKIFYDEIYQKGIDTAQTYIEGMRSKEGADTHSPSKKTYQIGADVAQGFINGTNDKLGEIQSSANFTASNWINGLIGGIFDRQRAVHNAGENAGYEAESGANSVSLFNVGDNFVGGFINGMLGGSAFRTLAQKAVNVASTAFNAIKNWLGIHSPSKETEKLGEYFSDGFAIGISKSSKKALAEASRLAKDTSGALTPERLANAADSLSGLKSSFQSAGLWSSQSVTNTTNSPTFNMTVNVNSLDSNTDINAAADKLMRVFGQKIQSDKRKWG